MRRFDLLALFSLSAVVLLIVVQSTSGKETETEEIEWHKISHTDQNARAAVLAALRQPELFDEPVTSINRVVLAEVSAQKINGKRKKVFRVRADLKTQEGLRSMWEIEAVDIGLVDSQWEVSRVQLIQRRPNIQEPPPYPGSQNRAQEYLQL